MPTPILNLLINIIGLYLLIIFVWVVASWLITFGIINTRNPLARNIVAGLDALVAPVVAPIRRILPPIGGLDLSPIVVIFALIFIRDTLATLY